MKLRGRCSVSNILTVGGKRFDSLPRLEAYLNGVCWLHAIATCPYGDQCSFNGSNISKGALSDAQADKAVSALQAGVLAMVARNGPPSLTGKRKVRAGRGRGRGGVGTAPPAMPQACQGDSPATTRGGAGEYGAGTNNENRGVGDWAGGGPAARTMTEKLLCNPNTAL